MSLSMYIRFNGNCRQAVEYYAEVLGCQKPNILTFAQFHNESDFHMSEKEKNYIMHTCLSINGQDVMFSDCLPGMPVTLGNNFSLAYSTKNKEEITHIFNRLKDDGGQVGMELQETFWSDWYGSITDKFGIGWQFTHDSAEAL
ncbi:PhnB protein [Hydrogenoanaerobacterium saccharovorans]|uniref:PhnB protein n=1 Tax=Hydrogenoanaerobacterium saccharovorans TaxID=474960 RepID=A0A1H8AQX2_9FIRM|nr:VOC family protein [Hydrogenoanaerobacterium saccharovorans]RPF47841.1 PhnB protein [Hydrogenoanaerobacterium saccharovorans]SEM72218.1 PhnB protein [Hydrogenoanaerobacterium saccharovorans]